MINLYVKFNVHSSYAKQVIVLKVSDRRTRLVTTIGIRQNFGQGLKSLSVLAFRRFFKNAHASLQEGYLKFLPKIFYTHK